MINKLFKLLGHFKVYFLQSGTYVGIVNFIMLLASVKQLYNIDISVFIIIPMGVIGITLIGFIDYKFIYQYSIEHFNKKNDVKKDTELIIKILSKK